MIALSELRFAYPGRKALFSELSLAVGEDERSPGLTDQRRREIARPQRRVLCH